MAFELKFVNGGEGIECTASGAVHSREIVDINRRIYREPYLTKQKYQIVDLTGAESVEIDNSDVLLLAEMDKAAALKNPKIKIAVVAPGDLEFGVARMWQAYVDESEFESRVVRTREEAELWIKGILSDV